MHNYGFSLECYTFIFSLKIEMNDKWKQNLYKLQEKSKSHFDLDLNIRSCITPLSAYWFLLVQCCALLAANPKI